MLDSLINLYAPHSCLGCQMEGRLLCRDCQAALPTPAGRCYRCRRLSTGGRTCRSCRRHTKIFSVNAIAHYDGLAKELVGRLKFSGARAAASIMAESMASQIPSNTLVMPVPTATGRIRLRGYDQAVLLAKVAAQRAGASYLAGLQRQGQHRQVGASRQQRLQQLQGSFVLHPGSVVTGKRVVLIDDVLTTGATLEAAAAVIKVAGAKRVEALVFARA